MKKTERTARNQQPGARKVSLIGRDEVENRHNPPPPKAPVPKASPRWLKPKGSVALHFPPALKKLKAVTPTPKRFPQQKPQQPPKQFSHKVFVDPGLNVQGFDLLALLQNVCLSEVRKICHAELRWDGQSHVYLESPCQDKLQLATCVCLKEVEKIQLEYLTNETMSMSDAEGDIFSVSSAGSTIEMDSDVDDYWCF